MKNVLLAFTENSRQTVGPFPHLFAQAGLSTTVIAHPKYKTYVGRDVAQWIDGSYSPTLIIAQIAELFAANPNAFDWVVLADDDLLRALASSSIPAELKTRIGPIGKPEHFGILGDKCQTYEALSKAGIRTPAFRACNNLAEVKIAVQEIKPPLVIKINHSLASQGTYICKTQSEIDACIGQLSEGTFLVEQFITGQHLGFDPLFIKGKLVAANACVVLIAAGGATGLTTARQAIDAGIFKESLSKIGETFHLNGFVNIGCIQQDATNDIYLFEMDCRPTVWPAYGKYLGADFAQGIKAFQQDGAFDPAPYLTKGNGKIAKSFIRDIPRLFRKVDIKGLMGWMTNKDECWQSLPFHDPRLFLLWIGLVMQDIAISILGKSKKILKSLSAR